MLDLQEFEVEKRRTELMWSRVSFSAFPERRLCKLRILGDFCDEDDGFALVSMAESLGCGGGDCVIENMLLAPVAARFPLSSARGTSELVGDLRECEPIPRTLLLVKSELS
jgi:hypothetical protein